MILEEYEQAGESLGRLLIKSNCHKIVLCCLIIAPISIIIGLKFLFI